MADLERPIVPVPDTSSLQFVAKGLAGMMANKRYKQQYELATQKMIQDTALENEKMDLARQKLANDFSVDQQRLSIQQSQLKSQQELNALHGDYYKARAEQARRIGTSAADQQMAYNLEILNLKEKALTKANEYGINDPKLQTENPLKYAAGIYHFEEEFGTAPKSAGLDTLIAAKKREIEQTKIPLTEGAVWDGSKWKGGIPVRRSPYQIVQALNDPNQGDVMMKTLQASGHSVENILDPTLVTVGKDEEGKAIKKHKSVEIVPDDFIGGWLKKKEGIDFSHHKSLVPEMIAPTSGAYKGTGQARDEAQQRVDDREEGLMEPDASAAPAALATPQYQPTETDQILGNARAALAAGAPLPALAQRLQSLQIDPNLLFNDTTGAA